MVKKIILKPKTSFSEMFSADQLWGQIIWAISDIYGKDAATTAVEEFVADPPFLISSLMVDGYLPKPFYTDIMGDVDSDIMKHNKKIKWLSYEDFRRLQMNCYYLAEYKIENIPKAFDRTNEIHASISRESFKVLDGGLFNSSYIWTENTLCFYLRYKSLSDEWKEKLNCVLDYLEKVGLGGDRNVGHGQFAIFTGSVLDIEKYIFDFTDSSMFVSLSDCIGNDITPISYALDVYSGISGRTLNGEYRKKPVVRYKTGSLFIHGTGEIISDTGSDSSCSYGLAFPVYMSYEEK